ERANLVLSAALGLVLLSSPGIARSQVSISLTPSRTTCAAPCFVRFDATGTTATTTAKPFHDLNYMWDFGDPDSGSWTAGAASSSSTPWPRNREYGALAGHVFDPDRDYGSGPAGYNQNSTCSASGSSARAYTVTLTVSATTGPSATATKTICVQSPDQAWGAS